MTVNEIVAYFAKLNMGSIFLTVVEVIWEKLDETEKQMIASLHTSKRCSLCIKSNLPQDILEQEVNRTPIIALN